MAIINLNKRYVWADKYKIDDTKIPEMTDGRLVHGTLKHKENARGQKIAEEFTAVGKLAYKTLSVREEDKELAKQMNTQVDHKVQVRNNRKLKEDHTVKIESDWYEIVRLDKAKNGTFIHLRKRRKNEPKIVEVDDEQDV